jgi:hypothetical protein
VAGAPRRGLAQAGVPLVLCPVDGPLADSPYLELLLDGRLCAMIVPGPHALEPAVVRIARTGRIVIGLDLLADSPRCIIHSTAMGRWRRHWPLSRPGRQVSEGRVSARQRLSESEWRYPHTPFSKTVKGLVDEDGLDLANLEPQPGSIGDLGQQDGHLAEVVGVGADAHGEDHGGDHLIALLVEVPG